MYRSAQKSHIAYHSILPSSLVGLTDIGYWDVIFPRLVAWWHHILGEPAIRSCHDHGLGKQQEEQLRRTAREVEEGSAREADIRLYEAII